MTSHDRLREDAAPEIARRIRAALAAGTRLDDLVALEFTKGMK